MRSVLLLASLGCGSASGPSNAPPAVAADEVATPTEQASAPQLAAPPSQAVKAPAKSPSFPATCNAIASEIETLTKQFPQLANYRAVDQTRECAISYSHETMPPSGRGGGYSAAIPRPKPNGIFLYIGIWDPKAPMNSQIDTQPASFIKLGERNVTLIISEGDQTKSCGGAIHKILERHGATQQR